MKISSIGLGMMSYGDPELQPWALSEDRAEPIVGATAERHLDDAIAALSIDLAEDEVAALERPYLPRLVIDYA
jgi:diketogulonate reductase-like aldo/keto reductase